MSVHRVHRVVVGSCGDDASARLRARALLMDGREVVFVGGGQTVEQVARAVEAEDAGSVVIDGSADECTTLEFHLATLSLGHVGVTRV